jgi:hypothetical protein
MPTAIVEIAYEDPDVDPNWIDETADLRSFSITRGRNEETAGIEPGHATVVLDNSDGRYDPTFRSGAHYPNLLPGRRLKISAELAADANPFEIGSSYLGDVDAFEAGTVTLALFVGKVESWEPGNDGFDALATVVAVDALKDFAPGSQTADMTGTVGSHVRMGETLDQIGWPALDRNIQTGAFTVYPVTGVPRPTFADLISWLSNSEGFTFFIGRDGRATWKGPQDALKVYGDAVPEERYQSFEATPLNDSRVVNYVQMLATQDLGFGTLYTDAVSTLRYGLASVEIQTLLWTEADLTERGRAVFLANLAPRMRVASLTLGTRPQDWVDVLRRDIQDGVTFRNRPPYGGTFEQDSVIEGISITSPNLYDWNVVWALSAKANPNLIASQNSGFEQTTGVGNWTGTNATLARVSTAAMDGGHALEATASANGDFGATLTEIPAVAGRPYHARATFGSSTPNAFNGTAYLRLSWRDASHAEISTTDGNLFTVVQSSDFGWSIVDHVIAPANTTGVVFKIVFVSGTTGLKGMVDLICFTEAGL